MAKEEKKEKKSNGIFGLAVAVIIGIIIGAGGLYLIQNAAKPKDDKPTNSSTLESIKSIESSIPESSVESSSEIEAPTKIEISAEGEEGYTKINEVWKEHLTDIGKHTIGLSNPYTETTKDTFDETIVTSEIDGPDGINKYVVDNEVSKDVQDITVSYNGSDKTAYIKTVDTYNGSSTTNYEWTAKNGTSMYHYDSLNEKYTVNDEMYTFEWLMEDERATFTDYMFLSRFDENYFDQYALNHCEPYSNFWMSVEMNTATFKIDNFKMNFVKDEGLSTLTYSVDIASNSYKTTFSNPSYNTKKYLERYSTELSMEVTIVWNEENILSRNTKLNSYTTYTVRSPGNKYNYYEQTIKNNISSTYDPSYKAETMPSTAGYTAQ
ncbi:MAG: hypothetical protein MJ238_05840 [Bacilli bacterium]|nr:hypothetical protein [Bacilli bacterium]